jgi:Ca-activated chloride channel family protein
MMRWAHPNWWWCVLLVPAVAVFWVMARRRRQRDLNLFADPALVPVLASRVWWKARKVKAAMIVLSIGCAVLALLGPQWGFAWEEVPRRGIDLVIALDVSKSMLAQDVKPNRLARAQLAIQDMVRQLTGDRVGLVLFAGSAFMPCPLTIDYDAFLLTLEEADPSSIPRGGTAIPEAIREGMRALAASTSPSRAIVLISDGESHEGDAAGAARDAAAAGVRIFSVGIGTVEGELIPVEDYQGNRSFLKDQSGRTVKSSLNESVLQHVALATGGSYVRATATSIGLDALYRERISKLEASQGAGARIKRYHQRYQWVLALGLLLLAVEPFISDRLRPAKA